MENSEIVAFANHYSRIQHILSMLTALAIVFIIVAWIRKGTLPSAERIREELLLEPIQEETQRPPFSLHYRGRTYEVTPQAEYEMWGLVVSHNDISAFSDIYHDKDSVDIKDLCTIWGTNVKHNDFQKVQFKSDCYVCRFRYPRGVTFNHFELANTHIICADPLVQQKIIDIRIGDQIRLKGMLVNYRRTNTDWERKTSLTRKDTGMGACEVMFVEDAEILQAATPMWYAVYSFTIWAIPSLLLSKLALMILKAIRDHRNYLRQVNASAAEV